jgi:hypothetical protein
MSVAEGANQPVFWRQLDFLKTEEKRQGLSAADLTVKILSITIPNRRQCGGLSALQGEARVVCLRALTVSLHAAQTDLMPSPAV